MGRVKEMFSLSAYITEEKGNHCRKGGYTEVVQNIYSIPPYQPEEHHKAIDSLYTIVQGMQTKSYEL